MEGQRIKSIFWRAAAVVIIASLALFSTITYSGMAAKTAAPKKQDGKIVLAPVEPPRIKTHPLHRVDGKNKKEPGPVMQAVDGAVLSAAAVTAPVHAGDPRDMKVLVISPIAEQYFPNENPIYDARYRLQAIKGFLEQIGIPYDVYVANSGSTHNALPALWDGANHGYYQGIILETGNQFVYSGGGNFIPFLNSAEWTALWNYEAMFGVRELVMFAAPNAGNAENYGLTYISEAAISGTAMPAALTNAGKAVYSYLNAANPVPFINTYYYKSAVDPNDPAAPLLVDPEGYPVVSTHTAADGHETLTITADYSSYLISSLALSYGSLNWLTKGVFLGERHTYLAPQVDDLLIADLMWNPADPNDTTQIYRMSGSDLLALKAWQNTNFSQRLSTCVTLQPAPAAGIDTFLRADSQTSNFGNNGSLFTRATNNSTLDRHSLIQFSLSGIPLDATVTSAVFNIYLNTSAGSQTDRVEIHRMTRAWKPGNGTTGTGASWTTYDGVNAWTTPGGDFDTAVSGSFVAGAVGWKQADLTQLVQGWVTNPTANNGMVLFSLPVTNSTNSLKTYYSSNAGSTYAALRPKLDVCYSYPASTFKLEFAFNGEGATGIYDPDTLTPVVIQEQANFRWVNHTYYHTNLDAITRTETKTELTLNDTEATKQLKLSLYSKAPFIQPDISGLTNKNFQIAAYTFGVRYLISDTSRAGWNNPSPNTGINSTLQPGLLIIPRHPSNLFYNLVTPEQWVSEYNCFFGPNATCGNGQWKYWDHDLSYSEILDKESDMLLQYMLKWDVDPLMFHQANLGAFDGKNSLLTQLVDAALAKYRALVTLPISNLDEVGIGTKMSERMTYNASGVKATLTPCSGIALAVTNAAKVPLTGVDYGSAKESYGGQSISYVTVSAGQAVSIPVTCP